ncbi:unnamed protein product [Prunus armeniaca]|uniref:Uncharacterized protein n=1 Tax=Prunus armeniaca TaxID=36596 RepID=A0A6J5Y6N6_PRUAR|nr:unnamed protein product [Prunus armeniaca]
MSQSKIWLPRVVWTATKDSNKHIPGCRSAKQHATTAQQSTGYPPLSPSRPCYKSRVGSRGRTRPTGKRRVRLSTNLILLSFTKFLLILSVSSEAYGRRGGLEAEHSLWRYRNRQG